MGSSNIMWKMINYEICGRGHKRNNIPCQDKSKVINRENTYVIALADGAGSASHSHFGAAAVVDSISKFLLEKFDDIISNNNGAKVKEEILFVVRKELENIAEEHRCRIEDLASTMLVVVVKDDNFLIIHVGDGVIGLIKDNEVKVASKPENGEFSNSTIFITAENAINYMKIYKGKTDKINGFIIMSDGTAESFYNKRSEKLSIGIKKIMNATSLLPKKKARDLLIKAFEEIISQNTLDDCSVAVLVRSSISKSIYTTLSEVEKCILFDINRSKKIASKKIRKYEKILEKIENKPISISKLAKTCHIKEKYLKREIKILESLELVKKYRNRYYI